ncbi:MAG: hypothetical protein JRJ43_02630 [Deltaproteobacteria bacterium]|nr:hypothetical protein [Deltaproteobacteria bacterium]
MKDAHLFFYSVDNNRTMTKNIDVHRLMAKRFLQNSRFCSKARRGNKKREVAAFKATTSYID